MNKPDVRVTKTTLLNLSHKQKRAQTTSQRTQKAQWRKCSLFSVILKLQWIHLQYQGKGGGNKPKINKQCLSPTKPVT